MKQIAMVDLQTQYRRLQKEIDDAVLAVMDSARFIGGPEVDGFKNELAEYLGAEHVIPCANGTDALQIAMMALGLKPGDEVIVPTFTYVATAEVIALLGLTPVMVDVDEDTFTLDLSQVEAAIGPKTKAIVPVHLYGQCADMEGLMALADRHGIHVIEDNAQAIGSDYFFSNGRVAKSGTIGTFGTTSFFPSKNLGCFGDGGAIFTNDDDLAKMAVMIASHGQSKLYTHDVVGVNSRLDAMQAAVLRIKLRHLDDFISRRIAVADRYDAAFANVDAIKTPVRDNRSKHVFHQYTLVLNGVDRNGIKEFLQENDIPSMIYYPIPLHKQKAFANSDSNRSFAVTEKLCDNVISLPIHTEMESEQQDYIIEKVIEFINKSE
ncbi:MAG: aminotransferase class I/II-fold pyridoxal phosphate-dependent enzyme [Flavobacteriales bacterium]|nr:aminotransferase class I/II-fold pyridoxal phosphate-dependent enzyme [Flavobacteriales bacterium]